MTDSGEAETKGQWGTFQLKPTEAISRKRGWRTSFGILQDIRRSGSRQSGGGICTERRKTNTDRKRDRAVIGKIATLKIGCSRQESNRRKAHQRLRTIERSNLALGRS